MYSCGCVIIDALSAGKYEIKIDCARYNPAAHTHVSAVAACEPHKNNYTVIEPHTDTIDLLYFPSTNKLV